MYTERGIKEIHGFMSERWRIEPEYAIKVESTLGILGVLLEPASVVAKAIEQIVNDWTSVILGTQYRFSYRRWTHWPIGRAQCKTIRV